MVRFGWRRNRLGGESMRTQGWSVARAAGAATLAGLLLAALAPTAAQAASTAPTLQAAITKSGTVKVEWKFTTDERRDDIKLRIDRKAPGDNDFKELKTFNRPRPSANYTDRDVLAGVRSYRAVLIVRGTPQAPGQPVSVGETAPPPDSDLFPPLAPGQSECPATFTAEVLKLVNDRRKQAGSADLKNHELLAQAARQRSIDMAASGNLSHNGWVTVIRQYGYRGGTLGENIAYGYGTPASVVQGWMNSDGHRGNILWSGYADSGVGCVKDTRGRIWWTQDFGR